MSSPFLPYLGRFPLDPYREDLGDGRELFRIPGGSALVDRTRGLGGDDWLSSVSDPSHAWNTALSGWVDPETDRTVMPRDGMASMVEPTLEPVEPLSSLARDYGDGPIMPGSERVLFGAGGTLGQLLGDIRAEELSRGREIAQAEHEAGLTRQKALAVDPFARERAASAGRYASQKPEWVVRDGKPTPVFGGEYQPGDKPYESARQAVKKVPAGEARRIAETQSAIKQAETLRKNIASERPSRLSRIVAAIPYATDITGWGTDAKNREAIIALVRQIVGKGLEGGVLRKEDEIKYRHILPEMSDPLDVVKSKLDNLDLALQTNRDTLVESLSDAGYDTSGFEQRFGSELTDTEEIYRTTDGQEYTYDTAPPHVRAAIDAQRARGGR